MVVLVAIGFMAAPRTSAAIAANPDLHFAKPTGMHLAGTTDLEVAAPAGTTAVRFYLDQVQLSELTDLYARQTGLAPVWATATDVSWFPSGAHTLRAEADTPSGTLTATKQVVTRGENLGPGITSLDGGWQFATAADLPVGALDGDAPAAVQPAYDAGGWPDIVVPDSFGAVSAKWNDDNGLLVVYRRNITLDPPDSDQRTALDFESCFWACQYYVNGTRVGSSVGGYLPVRLDVTDAVRPGGNTIAVVVDNRTSTMGAYAGPVQGLYWNWGGLLQQVRLERTPSTTLTEVRAQGTESGQLTLTPTGVNATGSAQRVSAMLTVDGPDGSRALAPRQVTTTVPAGGGRATPIVLNVADPQLWDLDHPNLYTVHLRPLGGAAWRELSEQTGFRDVTVKGLDVYLNGRPVEDLEGFDRHADYPGLGRTQPDGLADREIKQLHDKGFRIFRPAHYPTTPAELHAADEYGLLVIEEINNVTSQPANVLARPDVHDFAKTTLSRMVARDASHPSLFAWSVGNENATDTSQGADYVRDVISYGKQIDPTRLYTQVTDHPTTDRAYPYEDFLAENYYAGWYSGTVDSVSSVLDTVQQEAGKPIMISEYGAEAVAGRPGTGRGTEWYQAYIVDGYNRQLHDRPHFIGKMYWTSTEFWCTPGWSGGNPQPVPPFHTKALETYFRAPKLGWKVMFSPVRIADASVLEAPIGQEVALRERVTVVDARGNGGHGTLVVDPPRGFTADRVGFTVASGGSTTVDVTLHGTLTRDNVDSIGFIRAVVDSDTEALPWPITVRPTNTVRAPASDDFSSGKLDPSWQVTRPQADGWSLADRPGALRLSTLPGGETGATNDGRNLFVRTNTPEGDFTAIAGVDATEASADFQQVGVYGYVDDDNYAKIDLGWVDGRRSIEFVNERSGKLDTRVSVPYEAGTAKLRIVRAGSDVIGEYSTDGQDWYEVGDGTQTGDVRVALQALGGSTNPPVVPTYVDDLAVYSSGDVTATGLSVPAQPLFTGASGTADVTVTNGADHPVTVDATLDVPAGWAAGNASATVPAFGAATVEVPVTAGSTPQSVTVRAVVSQQGGAAVYGDPATQVLSAPDGNSLSLALDAGTATSPVLPSYRGLSPSDGWDPTTGDGWVGAGPQSRDRGAPDALRRDIVTDTAPRTLRIFVPAGQHEVYLLVGDHSFPSDAMTVSADGQTLVHVSSPLPADDFQWQTFTLDGGSAGRPVDLDFAADHAGEYWRFAALALR